MGEKAHVKAARDTRIGVYFNLLNVIVVIVLAILVTRILVLMSQSRPVLKHRIREWAHVKAATRMGVYFNLLNRIVVIVRAILVTRILLLMSQSLPMFKHRVRGWERKPMSRPHATRGSIIHQPSLHSSTIF